MPSNKPPGRIKGLDSVLLWATTGPFFAACIASPYSGVAAVGFLSRLRADLRLKALLCMNIGIVVR